MPGLSYPISSTDISSSGKRSSYPTMKPCHLNLFVSILSVALSVAWVQDKADAREVTINIGRSRDQAVNLLMETRRVSRTGALKIIADQERKSGTKIIDSVSVPEGAVMDYVKVNGDGKGPRVERQGSGILVGRNTDYGRQVWANTNRIRETDPAGYRELMQAVGEKGNRNYFVAKLTPEQLDRLKKGGSRKKPDLDNAPIWKIPEKFRDKLKPGDKPEGDGLVSIRGATQTRILVIGCTFPAWTDQSPRPVYSYSPAALDGAGGAMYAKHDHPIGTTVPTVAGAGGAFVNNGRYISSWADVSTTNAIGVAGGRIGPPTAWDFSDAIRGPQTYTTDNDFQNHWYNLVFNTTPGYQSLYNFLFINSHSKVALSGVLTDIKGWLQTHKHPLDVRDIGDLAPAQYYAPFPGTPLLTKDDPDSALALTLKGVSSSANTVAFYFNKAPTGVNISINIYKTVSSVPNTLSAAGTNPQSFTDTPRRAKGFYNLSIPITQTSTDGNDDRAVIATFSGVAVNFGTPPGDIVVQSNTPSPGQTRIIWHNPRGQSLTNLFNGGSFGGSDLVCRRAEILQPSGATPSTAHWMLSFNYYWHDHVFTITGSTAYQLRHLRNNSNGAIVDDLAGSLTDVNDREDRPYPYDFCQSDLGSPNGGYFESPNSTGTHNSAKWKGDVLNLINAYGFSTAGYDLVFFIFPNGGGGVGEAATSSFIPNAGGGQVVLPEDAGLGLVAHETLHTFGAVDLYDTDGPYYNGYGYQPPRNASDGGIKNYSVMAAGMRVDPVTKMLCGWLTPITATGDQLSLQFPSVEDSGSNPVVYKIPVKLPQNVSGLDPATDPSQHEYFLVENHNQQLFGDGTSKGLTIWHVDSRASTADSKASGGRTGNGMGDPNFLYVVPIQADGLYDIERANSGDEGDPFPGSTNNRDWMYLNPPVVGTSGGTINGPNSRSRGITDTVSGQVIPGTDFDTYIRLLNIHESTEAGPPYTKINGSVMVTDLYVNPREVVVTGTSKAPGSVSQGQTNTAFEMLTFTSSSPTDGGGISLGDVNILSIKFKQNGTSSNAGDITRVALFDDDKVNGTVGTFDPGIDPLVAQKTNPFALGQTTILSNLNYLIQNGASKARNLFVVYDISDTAQVNPQVTVGTEISVYTDVIPQAPGAVRQGPRLASGYIQKNDFPILSNQASIVASTHSLVVHPAIPNPSAQTIRQGQLRFPMLRLDHSVPAGQVLIKQLNLIQAGNDPIPADVVQAQIYEDTDGNGTFDDPNQGGVDVLLSSASFNTVGAKTIATFNNLNYSVSAAVGKSWFITYDISETAIVGATVSAYLPGTNLSQTTPFTTNGTPDIVLTQPVQGGAVSDTVSPANFPIDSGALQISRTGHTLTVKGRDVASPYADPDADPSLTGAPLSGGKYTGGNGSRLVKMKKLILSASQGNITLNGIKVDLPTGGVASNIASPVIPANNDSEMYGGVTIFEDLNNNDIIDASDKLVGVANVAESSVTVSVDNDLTTQPTDPFVVSMGTTRNLILALDCADGAVVSDTLQILLTSIANVDVSQVGVPEAGQDSVEFVDQSGNPATSLASPSVTIRGFVQVQNTPSNVDKIALNSTNVPMQNLTFKAVNNPSDAGDSVDKVLLESLKVNKFGSSTAPGDLSTIALYLNNGKDATFDGSEVLLQEKNASAPGWPSSVVFDNLNQEIPADGTEVNFLIAVDVPLTATPTVTVGTQLLNSGFINPTSNPNGVVVANSVFPMSSFASGSVLYWVQPDLLIKQGSEASTAYAIDGSAVAPEGYQTTPSGDQIEPVTADRAGTATYNVKIVNDGNVAGTFLLKAAESAESGWTLTYMVGTTDVTAAMTGAGYPTANLGSGQSVVVIIAMTPEYSVVGGTSKSATIEAYLDAGDTSVDDAVQALTTVKVVDLPDALIKTSAEADSAFAINDIYQTTPADDQIEAQTVDPARTASYDVKVENDGNTKRTFLLKAAETGEPGFNLLYKLGAQDISSAIKGAGYTTPALDQTESMVITVEVTPGITLNGSTGKGTALGAFLNASDTTVRDSVLAQTTANVVVLPDALIKTGSEPDTAYAINDEYQTTPAGDQIEAQNVDPEATATYHVKIENDGNTRRAFLIKATESAETNWSAIYEVGGTDITSALTGAGHSLTLSPDESAVIVVNMTPSKLVPGNGSKTATLSIYRDASDTTVRDAAQAVTAVNPKLQADAMIKQGGETDAAYAIDGTYQTIPSGNQVESQSVETGATAAFHVKIENDGNNARTFLVKAAESSETGWSVTYKVGGTDVTTDILGAGHTTSLLLPGESRVVAVTTVPDTTVVGGTAKSTTLSVFNDGADATVRDAVEAIATVVRPDLLIKKASDTDTGYASNNVYQTTPAGDQIESQAVDANQTATYHVKVENDGNIARTYVVRAEETTETGWTVVYEFGTTDISADVLSTDGYTTGSLSPGGSAVIAVEVTPDGSVTGSTTKTATLSASYSAADLAVRDAVQAVTTANAIHRPDLLIKRQGEADTAYAIDNEYQTVPVGNQVEAQSVDADAAATYEVKVENDGNTTRTYVVKAAETTETGWTISYKVDTDDVTSAIKGAGYTTSSLAPGASVVITVEMTPGIDATGGTGKSATLKAYLSDTDSTTRDAVKATTTANVLGQPDALIKKSSDPDTAYALDGTYQTTPSGDQVEAQSVSPGVAATYSVKVENDGNVVRTFLVKAVETAESGWTVNYKKGSADVTAAVKGAGYTTASLAHGQSEALTVEMTPTIGAAGGTGKSSTLKVFRDSEDTTVRDSVKASTTVTSHSYPDLLIRKGSEPDSAYAIDGSLTNTAGYQATPAGDQVETQSVDPSTAATYHVKVENDSNVTRTFVVKAGETAEAGWNLVYMVGTTDVTSALRGSGYATTSLAPGASQTIAIEMKPGPLAVGSQTKSTTLKVYLDTADTTVRDAVKASTTLTAVNLPDALIKKGSEADSAYAINNTYQTTPSGDQIEPQAVDSGGSVVYNVKVENDGNVTRSFLVKSVESGESGWSVGYQTGGVDIAAAVRGNGYTTASLAPGESVVVTIQMAAASAVRGNTSKSATVHVYLDAADTTVREVVKAVTNVSVRTQPDALIRKEIENDSAYAIDGVYQAIPADSQIETQSVVIEGTATCRAKIENDGNTARTFLVKATESAEAGWTVTYKVGATDITAEIRGNGYTTPTLDPGGSVVVTINATPGAQVPGGTLKSATLNVYLDAGDTTVRDSVRATTGLVTVHRPDALIKKSGEADAAYALNNVYQTVPSGDQRRTRSVLVNEVSTFYVKVENDGNSQRTFLVKAAETTGTGWTVVYKVGTTDVTSAIRGSGYTTSTLSPGASEIIIVSMTAGATALGGESKSATLNVHLDSFDKTVQDSVQATSTLRVVDQPDLLIKARSEADSAYVVNGPPYEATPSAAQTKTQTIQPYATIQFSVKVENDGNTRRSFIIKAVDSPEMGWTPAYLWDSENITADMIGATGFTSPALNPGENHIITISITAGGALPAGATNTTTITADSGVGAEGGEGRDAVLAAARVPGSNRPDLLIKKCADADTAFALNGTSTSSTGYQTTPAGDQIEQQNTVKEVGACYQVKVENDETISRTFNLRVEESSEAGWTLAYRQGTTNITEKIRSAEGWTTDVLEAGSSVIVSVEMSPGTTVPTGGAKSTTVKAYSDRLDTLVRDAVRATTTVVAALPPTVTSITPNSALNNGVVSITHLAGTGFATGATVRLTKTGQSDISGTTVSVVSSTQITCNIDLTGKATGQWNVVVKNTNGLEGTLANGFTITAPPTKDLAVTAFTASPNPVQRGKTVAFSATVKNVGTATASGGTFRIVAEANGAVLQGPLALPTLEPGQEKSGTLKMRVSRTTPAGEYMITAEVILAGDTNANNKHTIKLKVQ